VTFISLSLLKIEGVAYVFKGQMSICYNNLMNSRLPFQMSLLLATVLFFFSFFFCIDPLLCFHVGVDASRTSVLKGLFYLICFFVDVPDFGVIYF